MFDLSKCNSCGDCLMRCQYVDYSREKAIKEMTALIEGSDAEILNECITCMACNEYCQKGANPYDLILQLQEEKDILPVPEAVLELIARDENAPSQVTMGDPHKPAISFCVFKRNFPEGAFQGRMFDGLTIIEGGEYFCRIVYLHTARRVCLEKGCRGLSIT
jgi:ferredoxin